MERSLAVACGSRFVLSQLFPNDNVAIESVFLISVKPSSKSFCSSTSSTSSACAIAQRIGEKILASRAEDLQWLQATSPVPSEGPCVWQGVNPLGPLWAQTKPWVICDPYEFVKDACPPPACGSKKYLRALGEVREISDTRTAEQLAIAIKWAGNAGTPTPPGLWNIIASQAIARCKRLSLRKTAKIFYVLNTALFDASLVSWAFKYTYWFIRPYQADPLITTPIGRPNFPSYTSGHSTFSSAAATVLGHFFPNSSKEFWCLAEEAGISRIYGGIHFSFDNKVGLSSGKKVGETVLAKLKLPAHCPK